MAHHHTCMYIQAHREKINWVKTYLNDRTSVFFFSHSLGKWARDFDLVETKWTSKPYRTITVLQFHLYSTCIGTQESETVWTVTDTCAMCIHMVCQSNSLMTTISFICCSFISFRCVSFFHWCLMWWSLINENFQQILHSFRIIFLLLRYYD